MQQADVDVGRRTGGVLPHEQRPPYSLRKAAMGSTRVARSAGR
jgi:hypothetical protein